MTLHNFKKWLLFKRLKFFTTEYSFDVINEMEIDEMQEIFSLMSNVVVIMDIIKTLYLSQLDEEHKNEFEIITEEQQELAFKVFSDINGNDPSPWDANDHPEVDAALLNSWVLHLKNPKNIKKLFRYDENLIKSLICFIYHGN